METGKCIEGKELDGCLHYLEAQVDEEDSEPTEQLSSASQISSETVLLPSGERLRVDEVSLLLKGIDTRLVAIIGSQGAGKLVLLQDSMTYFRMVL